MNKYFAQFNSFIAPYGLAETDIFKLNQLCEVVSFNKGDIVFKSEVKAYYIYFICDGIIRSFVFLHTHISI